MLIPQPGLWACWSKHKLSYSRRSSGWSRLGSDLCEGSQSHLFPVYGGHRVSQSISTTSDKPPSHSPSPPPLLTPPLTPRERIMRTGRWCTHITRKHLRSRSRVIGLCLRRRRRATAGHMWSEKTAAIPQAPVRHLTCGDDAHTFVKLTLMSVDQIKHSIHLNCLLFFEKKNSPEPHWRVLLLSWCSGLVDTNPAFLTNDLNYFNHS